MHTLLAAYHFIDYFESRRHERVRDNSGTEEEFRVGLRLFRTRPQDSGSETGSPASGGRTSCTISSDR